MTGIDKTITVRISKDGKGIKVEADGFVGEGCAEATRGLIAKLGQETDIHRKNEFYVTEAEAIKETY